jgi:hypothetical protein
MKKPLPITRPTVLPGVHASDVRAAVARKKRVTSLLTATLLAIIPPAWAESSYRVDVVVFEHKDSSAVIAPVSATPVKIPDNIVDMRSLTTGIDPRFLEQGIQDASLQTAIINLQQKGYRILVQRSWTQPALDETQAKPVLIDGGNRVGDAQEVSGWIEITAAELPLIEASIGMMNNAPDVAAALVNSGAALPETRREPLAGLSAPATTGADLGKSPDQGAESSGADTTDVSYVSLKDQRRLKPATLTYLDHARIGVLVRFDRLQTSSPGL